MIAHLEHGDTLWVCQLLLVDDEGVPAPTVHVYAGEGVQLGVHPVETLVQQVWGDQGERGEGWRGWGVNRLDWNDL